MTAPIRVFTNIHNAADRVSGASDDLSAIYSRITSDRSYWEEANGNTEDLLIFNDKFETTSRAVKRFSEALQDEADTLHKIADNYEAARQRAVSRAQGINSAFSTGGFLGLNSSSILTGVVSGLLGMVGLGSVVSAFNAVTGAVSFISNVYNNPEALVTGVLGMAGLGSVANAYYAAKNTVSTISQIKDHPESIITTAANMAGLGGVVDKVSAVQNALSKMDQIRQSVKNGASAKEDVLKTGLETYISEYSHLADAGGKITDEKVISEIVEGAKELKDSITDPEETGDWTVPEKSEWVGSISVSAIAAERDPFSYKWDENKHDQQQYGQSGGTVPDTRKFITLEVGSKFGRLGSQEGYHAAPLKGNRTPFSAGESSLPHHVGNNIADESAYHEYEILKEMNEKTLQQKIYQSDVFETGEKMKLLKELHDYYSNYKLTGKPDGTVEKEYQLGYPGGFRLEEGAEYLGVKFGKTAPQYFGCEEPQTPGGGEEIILPLSIKNLIDLGFLKVL